MQEGGYTRGRTSLGRPGVSEAFVLNASLGVSLEAKEQLLGKPLWLPSGTYVVLAKFDLVMQISRSADGLLHGGQAHLLLAAGNPREDPRFGRHDDEDAADAVLSPPTEGDDRTEVRQTVVLTLAADLPVGGTVSAFGRGEAEVLEVRITGVQVDKVHVQTFSTPPASGPPHHDR
jgi:hypothetical protein